MQKKWKNQEEIKQALLRGDLTSQEAFELVTRSGVKPWRTKEWEKQRAARLGPACVQCDSTEPPLVLQHTWHPKDLKILIQVTRLRYSEEYEKQHPRPVVRAPKPVKRDACPRCKSTAIVWRKQAANWICHGKQKNRSCEHVFTEPVTVLALSPDQKSDLSSAKYAAYEQWYKAMRAAIDDQVRRDAVIQSIEDHQRYMTCEDTITLCKRCAFLWDMKKIKLCPICKLVAIPTLFSECQACGTPRG